MKLRIPAVCLAALMALSIPVASFAAEDTAASGFENFKITQNYTADHYKDVKSSDWFYSNVKSTYETGLMVGTDSRHFNPSENVTWAEAVALLARIHSIYKGDGHVFTPDPYAWYVTYVEYAVSEGIFSTQQVYGSLNDTMSRAAFVETLRKALPDYAYPAKNTIGKYDIPDVSVNAGYYNDVMTFYQAGILSGNNEFGFFNPYSNISRAECAAIITRIADPFLRNSFSLLKNPDLDGTYYAKDGSWLTLERDNNPPWSVDEYNEEDHPVYKVYINDQYLCDYLYDNVDCGDELGSYSYWPMTDNEPLVSTWMQLTDDKKITYTQSQYNEYTERYDYHYYLFIRPDSIDSYYY